MNRVHLGLALLLLGCFGTEVTAFPAGLEPLGESAIDGPGTAADPYPEAYEVERAAEEDGYLVFHGRGFIHAPPSAVWAALRDPAVGADRRISPAWSSVPLAGGEGGDYDHSYVVRHLVEDLITVEWDVTWRHGVVAGSAEDPRQVAIRWRKTAGSTAVRVIDGSIVLSDLPGGAGTEVALVYHASAFGSGAEDYMRYTRDVFADAVALSHGRPLPTY
jgi:hypothetical protein